MSITSLQNVSSAPRFGAIIPQKKVAKVLKKMGFTPAKSNRTTGGMDVYTKPGATVRVPDASKKGLGSEQVSQVAHQLGMTAKDFRQKLDLYA